VRKAAFDLAYANSGFHYRAIKLRVPRILKFLLMTFNGALAMGGAYLGFWFLIWLGHALFNDHPNFWITALENLHGAGSFISGLAYFLSELRLFLKDEHSF